MNYQHAFHAGNFADVHKHVVLVRILLHLRQKPAAFRVIDSHAGAGRYDLGASEPTRGGEWREGIAPVWEKAQQQAIDKATAALLKPYLDLVAGCNTAGSLRVYPGSPVIAQRLLRAQDRLIACELEPRSAAMLASTLRGDRRVKALSIDGWTAIGASVPPKERRGLVFIDPPFEQRADFSRLPEMLKAAHRKWPTGIYLAWYPITGRETSSELARRLQRLEMAKLLRCEWALREPRADAGLAGSGLIVVNPPFTLERDMQILLPALGRMVAAPGQGWQTIDWLAP
ncbi:MAG: 23S rRNA (adenine(2030)-N(6))-methyltransferase RlmJ [Xanthobacteraceae bacterium]